jgi:hypothetical protein
MVFLSEMSASNSSSSISMPWVSVVVGKRMDWKWRRKSRSEGRREGRKKGKSEYDRVRE